jgi:hypothetical protein
LLRALLRVVLKTLLRSTAARALVVQQILADCSNDSIYFAARFVALVCNRFAAAFPFPH